MTAVETHLVEKAIIDLVWPHIKFINIWPLEGGIGVFICILWRFSRFLTTHLANFGSLRSPFLSRETVQIHYFGSYSLSPLDRPLYDCMTVQFHWFGPSCLTPMVDTGRIRTIPVPRSLIKTIGWYRWVIISSHFSRKWLNSSEITWFGPYVLNMWLSYVKNSVDSWTPSGVLPFYWKIGLYELGPSMVQVLIDQYYSSTKTYAIWLKIKLFSSIWTRTISEFI